MLAIALLACADGTGEPKDGEPADTDDVPVDTDLEVADTDADTDEPLALEPASITEWSATCDALAATIVIRTSGRADRGRLFIASTYAAANGTIDGENHPMLVLDEDPAGAWTDLGVYLVAANGGVTAQVPGVSSGFTCDRFVEGLTYVARIYDDPGNLTDCLAWGDDGPGLIAGDYDELLPDEDAVVDPAEVDGCFAR